MELRQLDYPVTVVDEGSCTRAVRRPRVARPGLSARITTLAREVGDVLPDRSGRQVPRRRIALACPVGQP